jgi:hypothetical protein
VKWKIFRIVLNELREDGLIGWIDQNIIP